MDLRILGMYWPSEGKDHRIEALLGDCDHDCDGCYYISSEWALLVRSAQCWVQVRCSRQSDKDNLALSPEHGSCCLGLDTDSIALIRNNLFALTCIFVLGEKEHSHFVLFGWLTAIRLRYHYPSSSDKSLNHQQNVNVWTIRWGGIFDRYLVLMFDYIW